jgi:Terpene cyclase DEP1
MKKLYLLLAVLGAIIPFFFFYEFIQMEGFNVPAFVSALFVNGAAAGFSADLLISSFVFWLFMFQQEKRKHGPKPYLFIILNLAIGLSCALPAYLYVREKSA